MAIFEFRVEIGGFPGAPGINTFFGKDDGDLGQGIGNFKDGLQSMYTALKAFAVSGVTWSIIPACKVLDPANGDLLDVQPFNGWTVTASGTDSKTSRATQAKFQFLTDKIVRNRLVRGGIFFGPLNDDTIDTAGNIDPGFEPAVQSAFSGLLDVAGDMRMVVWSRPKVSAPIQPGDFGFVQQVTVWDLPAVLRSRRA